MMWSHAGNARKMGLERFSGISDITLLPSMILMALAAIGVALLMVWCAKRFEIWWTRR
jgi:hypothetical protein